MILHRRTCQYCRQPFLPDKYNHHHQRYCAQLLCREASARDKRRRWRETRNHDPDFRDREVQRVQQWRRRHPDYAQRRRQPLLPPALESAAASPVAPAPPPTAPEDLVALRDRVQGQADILVGLAWQWLGAQPHQLTSFLQRCQDQGRQIRCLAPM